MSKTTVTFVPSLTLTYEDNLLESVGIGGEMYVRSTPLKYENTKLRELVEDLYELSLCFYACTGTADDLRLMRDSIRELGIEVE